MMLKSAEAANAKTVVEIGPGTGAFTGRLLENLGTESRFFAVEVDPEMCARLRQRFPEIDLVNGDAAELPRLLSERDIDNGVDAIVSGLPWAAFPDEAQRKIMSGIFNSLAPRGRFATFAYLQGLALPAGKRFRKLLESQFGEVRVSPIVWANVPPAIVYVVRR